MDTVFFTKKVTSLGGTRDFHIKGMFLQLFQSFGDVINYENFTIKHFPLSLNFSNFTLLINKLGWLIN